MARRRRKFWDCTLRAPYYRDYFVDYVATCFATPADYVDNNPHSFEDPLGVLDSESWASRIFEVRFEGDLELSPQNLLAVFLPANRRRNVSGALHDYLQRLRDVDVEVLYYPSATHQLRRRVRSWFRRYLERRYADARA